ncbi:ABC transporter ATP-binding protein [Lutispora thermophila]|uniref:Peptide/nickel transport system ATP-binding protein n=1 Tax=Lutispora thermophila DSM 19022 TaxID=1122184 RepID=A0A1M6GPF3_9FIRM|nr:peptide/nickel transport system ATP-binding protein [Lutispora thermophila DSM 19022]
MMPLLKVENLQVSFPWKNKSVKAVDGVSFDVPHKKIIALVGESGSGKSVTALSVMGLIAYEGGKIEGGEIIFDGQEILRMKEKRLSKIRGKDVAMIYQDPMASLNPGISVGDQIRESLLIHKIASRKESKQIALNLMREVGIPDADQRYGSLPASFSGGMRQRIMIAMAISCRPKLLIADEPTTALDVSLQADIMNTLQELKNKIGMSILLITHDLGLVAQHADNVVVMYCGKVMEESPVDKLFEEPLHPYTIGLMNCIPRIDVTQDQLFYIPGCVPSIYDYPMGCRFHNRCSKVKPICREKMPKLINLNDDRKVRCWLYQ